MGRGSPLRSSSWQTGFVQQGREVCCLRDPGATQLGKKLRAILLGEEGIDFSLVPEMLLYMASRAQMVTERIKPALEAGQIVLTDRYLLSNVAYQGVRAGVDRDQIWTVGQIATQGIVPDLTFANGLASRAGV